MQFKLELTEDAENDVEAAMGWYENKQEGLGSKYVLSTSCFLFVSTASVIC